MEAKGNWSQAEAYYDDAIASDSDNAFAHYSLGKLLNKQDKLEEAFYEAKLALSCNPTDSQNRKFVEELRRRVTEATERGERGSSSCRSGRSV